MVMTSSPHRGHQGACGTRKAQMGSDEAGAESGPETQGESSTPRDQRERKEGSIQGHGKARVSSLPTAISWDGGAF